jgi:uncharacterized protein
MLKNISGQVVEGENFFDRTLEIQRYWRTLETDNLLMLAPRRVGKSSVLKRMKAYPQNDMSVVFADVSDCSTEFAFIKRLYSEVLTCHSSSEQLWNSITQSWLGKKIARVKKAGVGPFMIEFEGDESHWPQAGETLADAIASLEKDTLIQIDEMPVFLLRLIDRAENANQDRIHEFLYWMRRLRQSHPNVRWMLAGSIGLDTIAARLNISDAINDLKIETLGAFDEQTAHQLLANLGKTHKIELADKVRDHLVTRIGWLIPYYLQLIFNQLREHPKPDIDHVDQAIDTLLDPSHKAVFDFWRQRLNDEMGIVDAGHAYTLLNHTCRDPKGVRRSTLKAALSASIADPQTHEDKLHYLLDVLQNDGYLIEESSRWSFRSPLLREYWLRRVAPPESDHE